MKANRLPIPIPRVPVATNQRNAFQERFQRWPWRAEAARPAAETTTPITRSPAAGVAFRIPCRTQMRVPE